MHSDAFLSAGIQQEGRADWPARAGQGPILHFPHFHNPLRSQDPERPMEANPIQISLTIVSELSQHRCQLSLQRGSPRPPMLRFLELAVRSDKTLVSFFLVLEVGRPDGVAVQRASLLAAQKYGSASPFGRASHTRVRCGRSSTLLGTAPAPLPSGARHTSGHSAWRA